MVFRSSTASTYDNFGKIATRILSSYSSVNGSLISQSKSVLFYDQNQQSFLIKSYNNLTNIHTSTTRYYYTYSPTAVSVKDETKPSFHWLMPNPYSGQNILLASDYTGNMTLRLVDISGKTLEQKTIQSDSPFQLTTEANGLFFLQLSDQNGRLLDTQKIVLHK